MPRAVNAHAYVNATFSMAVDSGSGFIVTAAPSIVFGGIDTHAVRRRIHVTSNNRETRVNNAFRGWRAQGLPEVDLSSLEFLMFNSTEVLERV